MILTKQDKATNSVAVMLDFREIPSGAFQILKSYVLKLKALKLTLLRVFLGNFSNIFKRSLLEHTWGSPSIVF